VVGDQQFDLPNEHIEIGAGEAHIRRGDAMTPDIRRDMPVVLTAEQYQSWSVDGLKPQRLGQITSLDLAGIGLFAPQPRLI